MRPPRWLPGPMEGVMRPALVRAANRLELFPEWVTPFFRFSTALPRRRRLAEFAAPFLAGGRPVTVQIMGTDPAVMAAGAAEFAALGAGGIDLNFGCPSRQVTGGGAGGGALRRPEDMRRIVEAVRTALPDAVPLGVKIRSGWSDPAELPAILAAFGSGAATRVTLHYRTVAEQYRRLPVEVARVRWRLARERLDAAIELIVNGDLDTPEALRRETAAAGAAGAMAARGVLRDPYLLRRTAGADAPEPETGRRRFFRQTAEEAARDGGFGVGRAIELSNFIWGAANPFFAALRDRPPAAVTPEWIDRTAAESGR